MSVFSALSGFLVESALRGGVGFSVQSQASACLWALNGGTARTPATALGGDRRLQAALVHSACTE